MSRRHIFIRRTVVARRVSIVGYVLTILAALSMLPVAVVAAYIDAGELERYWFHVSLAVPFLFSAFGALCFLLSDEL